ncbi:coat F domain-containing protein [Natranaerovirga pectinivora]|uniref:Coat F domain-containing protein n=1 Tax=Natranaerovirga pectinivora TaxID=682400 RepID=A0A4R3MLX5_9FIRM|nr:spore coat protein [Natranaerovirga pectinivora]TCT15706.1 coat F domain-containing protein [Natranaerovirga pectinivora]
MNSFLTNRIKSRTDITDEVIVSNMLAASVGAANVYLNATVSSTTPELRSLYASGLSEVITDNSALNELALKKNWEKPYDAPSQQLTEILKESMELDLD